MNQEEVIRILRAPDQRGTGRVDGETEYGAPNVSRLTELDSQAVSIRAFDPDVAPGLLQIPTYSEGVLRVVCPRLPDMEIRRRMLMKSARTQAFRERMARTRPGLAYFVLSENSIVNPVTDRQVHADQLMHLLKLARHPWISIQILPTGAVTPALAGHFLLYAFRPEVDGAVPPRLGYVETVLGAYYSTRLEDLGRLHGIFADMDREAMTQQASQRFVREVLASWRFTKMASPEPTREDASSSPATPETTALESPERARPWRAEP